MRSEGVGFLCQLRRHICNLRELSVVFVPVEVGDIPLHDLHRGNPTAVRHRCAQCYDSENEHSAVTAMVRIVLLQR